MPNISIDSAGIGGVSIGFTNEVTFSHTCSASPNIYLVVAVAYFSTELLNASATYNGVAMTSLGKRQVSGTYATQQVEFFGLEDPASGANNVVVTFTGTDTDVDGSAGAISFTNVDFTDPTDAVVGDDGEALTALGVTVNSDAGDYTVACLIVNDPIGGNVGTLDDGHNFFADISDTFLTFFGASTYGSGTPTFAHNFTWDDGGSGTASAVIIGLNINHVNDNNPRGMFAVI